MRSVAKNRSATMPTKNGEIIAASAVVPYARPICWPEKCSVSPSQVPMVTYHAPHTKYSRNIMADSFARTLPVMTAFLCPPWIHRRIGEHHAGQKIHRRPDALVDRRQRVFMLDAHDVVVPDHPQRGHDFFPRHFVVTPSHRAEKPRALLHPAVALDVNDAVDGDIRRIQRDVLRMHVKNRVAEGPDGGGRLNPLPEKVARIEVHAEVVARLAAQAQRRLDVVNHEARMRFERHLDAMLGRKMRRVPPVRDRFALP